MTLLSSELNLARLLISRRNRRTACFSGWSGHGDHSFNCDRVGLEAIRSGNMAHEGGFTSKEFHLVDIHLDMMLFKSLKHGDKAAVVFDSGFRVIGATARD